MKKIYFTLLAALFAVGVHAQKMQIWSNDQVICEQSISSIDSIIFVDETSKPDIYPYFIGAVSALSDVHDFSTGTGHDSFITSHIGSGATSTIKFVQYNTDVPASLPTFNPNSILEPAYQFVFVLPKDKVNDNFITSCIHNDTGIQWVDIDTAAFKSNYNNETHPTMGDEVTINGIVYKVFTIYSKKNSANLLGQTFNVTFNK